MPLPATAESLRNRLKSETKPFHRAVESAHYQRALSSGNLSLAQYARYLNILLGIHSQWETQCATYPDWAQYGIRIEERSRIPQLHMDLAHMGIAVAPAVGVSWMPGSFAQAAGLMYVLEGSTLGGNILAERVPKIFAGQVAAECTHYFRAYGSETMRLWREYCDFLDRFGEAHADLQAECIAAASSAFTALEEAFNADEP